MICTAKAVIDETFPSYVFPSSIGVCSGQASEPHVLAANGTRDCLLSIGYRPIEVTPGDFTASVPADTIRAPSHSFTAGLASHSTAGAGRYVA
ncbi:hypothetical protein ABT187_36715 [Streptomyces sp. NPDC001817]|uniref:hypothetical protein n=1 Tax=Streptomyces sp. NPDC001817 TaxID=3154398 RepID=UPI00331C7403